VDDGYEVAAKMREIAPAEDTAIVVLSSSLTVPKHVSPEQLQIARKLSKPIRRAELHDANRVRVGEKFETRKSRSRRAARRKKTHLLLVETTSLPETRIRLLEKMGHHVHLG